MSPAAVISDKIKTTDFQKTKFLHVTELSIKIIAVFHQLPPMHISLATDKYLNYILHSSLTN